MRNRVLTALVAIPIVLGAVFYPHPFPIFLLATIAAMIGASELGILASGVRGKYPLLSATAGLTLFAGLMVALLYKNIIPFSLNVHSLMLGTVVAGCGLWLAGMAALAMMRPPARSGVLSVLATFWVSSPLLALALMVGVEDRWVGRAQVLQILVPVWAGDIAGILVGMAFGKKLLAPSLSPKKTVAGAIGNLVFAVVAAMGVAAILSHYDPDFGIAPPSAALLGLVISILGQAGDLFESWLKRRVNVKDSGSILPGHGGILDRIDSLLAVTWPGLFLCIVLATDKTLMR